MNVHLAGAIRIAADEAMSLNLFHPAVETWFREEFQTPTEAQDSAWPAIKEKRNTLIAAPTGSGKTLAAFLAAIDDLVREAEEEELPEETRVIYISPLKALGNDIEKNLRGPLQGIQDRLRAAGRPVPSIQVGVRSGDTPASKRTAMLKHPPHILVTTPESFFLLLTSKGGRGMIKTAHTVIVDEIHAIAGSKRGSHLSLSLERMEALRAEYLREQEQAPQELIRVGLSATQKPIERIAHFLVGNRVLEESGGRAERKPIREVCSILDSGHKRKLLLDLEIPRTQLTAVMPNEVWEEIYDRLAELIQEHTTTLIFVNTRRMTERMSRELTDRIGEVVAAHHGSMSKEKRLHAETRLKNGELKALVATASLELGIDIGAIDLVCQIGSTRSISAFLQRVGRASHQVHGTPRGIVFPLSRDELVECTAMLDAVRRGELDEILIPPAPLDILAQQIVAEVSQKDFTEDELFALMKKSFSYRDLERGKFDSIIQMLVEGFTRRRGRGAAYLHHDIVNKRVSARRGAGLAALTSGGAIPDNFDYEVILEPKGIFIGTINEDFAIESMAGDIFQLGNNSWRILQVSAGKVRVSDAGNAPPSIPFWLGEAPSRTSELSHAVARLREDVSNRLGPYSGAVADGSPMAFAAEEEWKRPALEYLTGDIGIGEGAAHQLVSYLGLGKLALGAMATQTRVIIERFFDEASDMHLVIHAPFGGRLNRAWGLALRKRFCKKFNFELQAAATEDNIVLSLGATHSFPLEEVKSYLHSNTVRDVLIQAMLDAPMFEIRWRWNASRALAIPRRMGGKKVPANIQRMRAQDLVAQVFPDQIACQENIAGPRDVPDHPLVTQTIDDCLHEAMDIEHLESLLRGVEAGEIEFIFRDLREPSPLAQEILNARPYAFLDDAPLEERRTNAVANRRWLDPSQALELGRLDPLAIAEVRKQAWPDCRNADELHDALVLMGFLTGEEIHAGDWLKYFQELRVQKRATVLKTKTSLVHIAIERLPQFLAIFPEGEFEPVLALPEKLAEQTWNKDEAMVEIMRGRLEGSGPLVAAEQAGALGLETSSVTAALLALENEGFVFRGRFTDTNAELEEWCERRLLARIHKYTLEKLRREIAPVSQADFMRFLFARHGLDEDNPPTGPQALEAVVQQLEAFEAPAAAWESEILPARLAHYDPAWLDFLCLSGKVLWGRFRPTSGASGGGPLKTTPIMFVGRANAAFFSELTDWLRDLPLDELSTRQRKVVEALSENRAAFADEIMRNTGLLPAELEKTMGELVGAGLITCDSFSGIRSYLRGRNGRERFGAPSRGFARAPGRLADTGRWSLLRENFTEEPAAPAANSGADRILLESAARLLLRRYGVVFRRMVEREVVAPPWRELVRVFRTLEARGEIRGGRFVDGVWGEQFALPEAVTSLRKIRKLKPDGRLIALSVVDPLNLHGVLTDGRKVKNIARNRIVYRDGEALAALEKDQVHFFIEPETSERYEIEKLLIRVRRPERRGRPVSTLSGRQS